jgi:selenium-dependent xanthine dehydrogenase
MHSSLLKFMVNNEPVEVEIVPGEMLVDVLRKKLKLTGTKVGCNEAECGACTVIVDGKPILSCSYPAEKVSGRSVITIEGLAHNGKLHPLQQEFAIKGAVQCGFCIPGQIMTAYALLQETPKPSQNAIRTALKDTLCRCGGYPSIEKAIRSALNDDTLPATIDDIPAQSRFEHRIIGKNFQRPDATAKVTGAAIYTDDLTFPGMLFGGTKRAMVAHGILKRINLDSAKCIPGVRAILTAVDIPGDHYHGLVVNDWPVLVGIGERIRYEGDAIALVAAESPDILQEALNSISLEIDELPAITDPKISMGCPNLHPNGNLLKHIKVKKGDIEKGFEEADLIFEDTFKTVSTDHAFIEPECSIARLAADGRMEIYVGSQIPYADRNQVAKALGWGDDRVRIIGMLIGGGFGGKEDITGQIHAALLTYYTRLPVKILYTRHESLLVHPKRHATQIKIKLGSTSAGKLVAMQTELYGDTGAYASLGEKVMTRATTHSSGPYEAENVKADCYAVYTNNPPAGAFRGFGVTQSTFAIETMMDVLAEKISVDPIHLRKMNALKVGSVTNTGQTLTESVGLLECLDKVEHELKHLGESKPFIGKNVAEQPFLRSAWGIAAAYKNTGLGGGAPDKAGAEIELLLEGVFEVRTSSAEIGQGLVTVLQMIASEELGFSLEHIRVLLSDTDLTPDGGPTTASRQTYVTGNAVRHAAGQLRNALLGWIAEIYDVSPGEIHFVEGLVQVGKQLIPLKDIAREISATDILPKVQYEYWAPKTLPLGNGGDMHFAYSYAVQAAQVQVDIRYGIVTVKKVISALDVGSIINPLGLNGQIEGGVMMGLGNALLENFITENGHIITDRLAKYRIPSIIHTPEIISHIIEHPTAEGPYGAKGVGEIVSIPTTPAITNAIYNAVGVRIRQLPVDQEYIALEIKKRGT